MKKVPTKVNIMEKLSLFDEFWVPKIIAEVNDCYIKVVKFKGEYTWHSHETEDELFWVIKGKFTIKLRDKDLELSEGEFALIPSGVEHKPVAEEETHVVLIEPRTTVNTGKVIEERTIKSTDLEWI
jgi:mannose-6-phosphate isomerase-like protein (cupin superfamily)